MNTTILQKCLDELNKDDFRKDYVIGMLETLVELQPGNSIPAPITYIPQPITSADVIISEEDEHARAYKSGPIGKL